MKKVILILLICAGPVWSQTQITWKDLQKNIDSWIKGPVRLILTDEEKDVFKKLKSPDEKMQFIKIFWSRRDPVLRTRENEFKEEFYARVEHANANFAEGSLPGWETARGQVYILFGPPQREEIRLIGGASRPALLWVYDRIPSSRIPRGEALLFVYRDLKYVLLPPNPDPGDYFGQAQRQIESGLRYQTIPSLVEQAFTDTNRASIVDEKKDYRDLLFSVKSTERFGLAGIKFDMQVGESRKVSVILKPENLPVYDDGEKVFTELHFRQELKKGDVLVAGNEHSVSYSWDQNVYAELTDVKVDLPVLDAEKGEWDLWITVQDRISQVSESQKMPVQW